MPSSRTTTHCVVTEASLEQDGRYTLSLRAVNKPNSTPTKTIQKPNAIMDHRCRASLVFPGFPQGTECQKGFATESQLKMHQKSVHNLEPFACSKCDFITVDGSNFDKHAKICRDRDSGAIRKKACRRCGKENTRSDNNKRHEKTCKAIIHLKQEQEQEQQQQQQAPAPAYGPAEAFFPPLPELSLEDLAADTAYTDPTFAANLGGDIDMVSGLNSTLTLPTTAFDLAAPMDNNLGGDLYLPAFSGDNNFDPVLYNGLDLSAAPADNYLGGSNVNNPVFEDSFDFMGDPVEGTTPVDNNLDGNMNIDFDSGIDAAIFGDALNVNPALAQDLELTGATNSRTFSSGCIAIDPALIDNQAFGVADTPKYTDDEMAELLLAYLHEEYLQEESGLEQHQASSLQ